MADLILHSVFSEVAALLVLAAIVGSAGLLLHYAARAVSTVPVHLAGLSHADTRLALVQALRAVGFAGRIAVAVAVAAHHPHHRTPLLEAGADRVIEPFIDAADRAIERMTDPLGTRP